MRNKTNIKENKYSTGLLDAYSCLANGIIFGEKLNKSYKKKKDNNDYVIYAKIVKKKKRR